MNFTDHPAPRGSRHPGIADWSRIIVLAGEPIDEPTVQYGPFVMNAPREIQKAFDDFNRGGFGRLDD